MSISTARETSGIRVKLAAANRAPATRRPLLHSDGGAASAGRTTGAALLSRLDLDLRSWQHGFSDWIDVETIATRVLVGRLIRVRPFAPQCSGEPQSADLAGAPREAD